MSMAFEDQIRERAYHIWLAGGMADGQAHEHWVRAEQAVRGEIAGHSAELEIILTKAPARKAAATKTAKKSTGKTTAGATAKAAKPVAKASRASKAKKVELSASI